MKKRLLSALLALCMMLTMMPTVAFAADEPGAGTADPVADPTTLTSWAENGESTLANSSRDTGRIWTDKSVSTGNVTLRNSENTQTIVVQKTANADFLVGLSALSSASSLATTTSKPLDIVLVLDVSGSMDNDGSHIEGYTPVYNIQNNGEYYIADGYRHRELSYENGRWYYSTWNIGSGWERHYVTPKESENDNSSGHVQFYVYSRVTKMEALQDAVGQFIDSTKEKNTAINNEDLKHRIALVKFASDSDNDIGNGFTDEEYNKSQVVSDFTTGLDNLKQTVNSLQGEGATRADFGMEQAERVINGIGSLTGAREEAEKIVIFFTDGNPTTYQGFSDEVAGSAINTAHDLKAAGVMIYSIGVFESADPSDTRGNFNKYMNAVSSNYPDAECTNRWGEQRDDFGDLDLGDRVAAGKQYYFAATNAEGLNAVFDAIDRDTQQAASPTEVVTNDPQHSGYITFTDQLGEYMEVKAVNEVVFAGQKFAPVGDPTVNGNVTTYHFEGGIPEGANSIYPNGNLSDLIVQVTEGSDAKTGDIVTVGIPASLIPLRYYDIKTVDGNTEMSISETYPIRVFYSVGLKDKVVDENGVATVDDSYAYKDDENVYFYSNAWTQNDGTATALTTAVFTPANTNSFYYITAGTPLYVQSGGEYVQASGEYDSSATYYYAHTYYTKESGTTTPVTQYEQVPAGSLSDANTGVHDGQLCVTESIAKTDSPQKFVVAKSPNATGTAAAAISPAWSESNVTVSLGNNGKVTATAPVTTGSLAISKTVTADSGLTAPDQEFTFTVTLKDRSGAPLADSFNYTVNGSAGGTITSGGTITLKHDQTATITGIPAGTKYEVTETPVVGFTAASTNAMGTIAADGTHTAAFINTYDASSVTIGGDSGNAGIAVEKVLTGRENNEWIDTDAFTFKLTAGDNTADGGISTPMPADAVGGIATVEINKDTPSHTASFGAITYDAVGEYYYTITENGGSLGGITYDDRTVNVTVEVKDPGDGQLTASVTYGTGATNGEAVFTNTYKAEGGLNPPDPSEGMNKLVVSKTLWGRDWTDDDTFIFVLYGQDGAPMPAGSNGGYKEITLTSADVRETTEDGWGIATGDFGDIHYTLTDSKSATYYYTISEKPDTVSGAENIDYDAHRAEVIVTVKDEKGNGKLTVDVTYMGINALTVSDMQSDASTAFTNSFEATGTLQGEKFLKVVKTIDGRDWKDDDQFTFTLEPQDNAPEPQDGNLEVTLTKDDLVSGETNTAVGSFGNIYFNSPDTYYYKITEQSSNDSAMIDSNAEYMVEVVVTNNGSVNMPVSVNTTQTKGDDGRETRVPVSDWNAAFTNYAKTITITPADVTIYMGGDDGYGAVEGSDTNTSLPDPLFHIDFANADGTDPESIIFKNETSGKSWTVVRAGETADGIPLYRLVAAEGQDPVRVQYLDGDQAIVSDTFVPALEHELYKEYAIELYYGGNQPDQISASVGNQTFSVEDKQGTLTVRVVENTESETDSNPVYHVSETAPGADSTLPATVTAPADTYYMRNDTTVRVDNEDGIGLLFDNIYDSDNGTNERQNALIDKTNAAMGAAASNVTRHYEARYLDLVDANDGNVWVKASQPVTVYWAYPEGTDANTTFSLYHYAGLHRDDQYDGQSGYDIDDINAITPQNVDVQKGEYGISFTVQPGGFSPFVLVWETSGGGTSGGGSNNKPDDLNTEDHFAYIIGYPKDYRTGEPTDDESLWPVEPQGNITRAEVATIFFRMLTDEARDRNWSQTNSYTDVDPSDWYNNAISTLSNMGIISGDPSGAFRPDDSITRAEFTKIAVGFFDKAGDYVDGTYDDVSSSDWYADFIDAAVDLGLIEGYPDGTIRPEATITRAEACTIVNRTLGRVPDKDHLLPADEMRVWPDNSDTNEWYYAQIQEATNSHDYEWIGEENDQIENWTEKLEDRDWAQLEREWSDANSAPGGEVVD